MYRTYLCLNVDYAASNLEVLRRTWRLITPEARADRKKRRARHRLYRDMLQHHKKAGRLYNFVMTGGWAKP
jgi:putative heme iron utilization protein